MVGRSGVRIGLFGAVRRLIPMEAAWKLSQTGPKLTEISDGNISESL
jgi:hypothetical protein